MSGFSREKGIEMSGFINKSGIEMSGFSGVFGSRQKNRTEPGNPERCGRLFENQNKIISVCGNRISDRLRPSAQCRRADNGPWCRTPYNPDWPH